MTSTVEANVLAQLSLRIRKLHIEHFVGRIDYITDQRRTEVVELLWSCLQQRQWPMFNKLEHEISCIADSIVVASDDQVSESDCATVYMCTLCLEALRHGLIVNVDCLSMSVCNICTLSTTIRNKSAQDNLFDYLVSIRPLYLDKWYSLHLDTFIDISRSIARLSEALREIWVKWPMQFFQCAFESDPQVALHRLEDMRLKWQSLADDVIVFLRTKRQES